MTKLHELVLASSKPFVTIPGYGGSGDDHWQTHWESALPKASRIVPASWDKPQLPDWFNALDEVVKAQTAPPVLVAHSLGCLLVMNYLHTSKTNIAGVFMVCVPDPAGAQFPRSDAADFLALNKGELRCPSLIVSSDNDPYACNQFSTDIATSWGSGLIRVGEKEHISDVATWEQGFLLLQAFCAGLKHTS